jgi:ATP-dependent exoDNAse (exonuclease V) beta subunit
MVEDFDANARVQALDPNESFIVRAPAGAGKTELLVQRYLALLGTVRTPEAIVAITFTIKAAGEMRARILGALAQAQRGVEAPSEHARRTLELARTALERDAAHAWRLAENPARLQIQTIDALCLKLARRMPVLARTQGDLRITERPRPLYHAAARMLLEELEAPAQGERLASLLLHLDGDEQKLIELIADMLDERDRWLRHIVPAHGLAAQRGVLEADLAGVVREALEALAGVTPDWLAGTLPGLAAQAGRAYEAAGLDSPTRACAMLAAMPAPEPSALPAWLGLAELLLTAGGELRKQPRPLEGFGASPARADHRTALQAILQRLSNHQDFVRQLSIVTILPNPIYDEEQWQTCAALMGLLPRAAAFLTVAFNEAGTVDFTEIAHAALRALGEPETPTDLALSLDQRIEHLLVDEFQDTSFTQLELLSRLTAGWSRGDGRSLFLVGDPMQSIYRFREAEVALFARVERQGLGALPLRPLQLARNFRAQAGLVDWVNERFGILFRQEGERTSPETVRFAAAEAVRERLDGMAVSVHPQPPGDYTSEARAVVDIVTTTRREHPEARIAVLVRAREHLAAILRELQRNGMRFRAVDVQPLANAPVVQDLQALTRALLHLADRVAWLAILRAPWCGLTLADLHVLAHAQRQQTVWEALRDPRRLARLSEDGQARLLRFGRVMGESLAERGRHSLRGWIEGTWTALGGSACVRSENEWANAQRFLRLLEELDRGGEPARLEELAEALAELYADPDPDGDDRLQLMTIHRAKGLEFDVVIVPSLGRAPGRRAERLLTLVEKTDARSSRLLVAPRSAPGQANPIGRYLRVLEEASDDEEAVRLLYVTATRARSRLHLLGAVRAGASGMQPRRDSLLARLWPAVGAEFKTPVAAGAPRLASTGNGTTIRRLPADWSMPGSAADADWPGVTEVDDETEQTPEFAWAGELARQVGRAVHRALERIARDGVERWDAFGASGQRARLHALLRELGVPGVMLDDAVERAQRAVRSTLADERGQWLLAHVHADARSEHELSAWLDDRLVTAVLDRTFVDERGVRWIVDFKAGAHEGAELETFLDEEVERYRPQLDRYARLMRRVDARPLRVGLYFPLLSAWREWEP